MSSVLTIDGKRWAVRLSGETIDLKEAAELFGSGRQIVRDEVLPELDAIVLQAEEFELLHEANEVYDAAERLLVPLNAVLYLEDPTRRPLVIGSIHRRNDDGYWSVVVFPQSASVRLRGARARGQAGSLGAPTPPTPQSLWVQTGLNQEVVADVLSYLRGTPDWIALYKAYEAVNRDVSALKSRKRPIAGWPSQAQISAFARDAQLHRHSKAWCDRKGITSTGAISLNDASALVRSMIRAWIEWRGQDRPTG
jgi:hypothetical protein